MTTEITDPEAREQAKHLLADLRTARGTGYDTGLLSGAERDLIAAVEYRLSMRLGEIPTQTTYGLGLVRSALAEIEREAMRDSARCVECGTTEGVAQQRDHQTNELVWLCARCHAYATGGAR